MRRPGSPGCSRPAKSSRHREGWSAWWPGSIQAAERRTGRCWRAGSALTCKAWRWTGRMRRPTTSPTSTSSTTGDSRGASYGRVVMPAAEDVAVVRRLYAAVAAGDLLAVAECFDEDAVWHLPGTNAL